MSDLGCMAQPVPLRAWCIPCRYKCRTLTSDWSDPSEWTPPTANETYPVFELAEGDFHIQRQIQGSQVWTDVQGIWSVTFVDFDNPCQELWRPTPPEAPVPAAGAPAYDARGFAWLNQNRGTGWCQSTRFRTRLYNMMLPGLWSDWSGVWQATVGQPETFSEPMFSIPFRSDLPRAEYQASRILVGAGQGQFRLLTRFEALGNVTREFSVPIGTWGVDSLLALLTEFFARDQGWSTRQNVQFQFIDNFVQVRVVGLGQVITNAVVLTDPFFQLGILLGFPSGQEGQQIPAGIFTPAANEALFTPAVEAVAFPVTTVFGNVGNC